MKNSYPAIGGSLSNPPGWKRQYPIAVKNQCILTRLLNVKQVASLMAVSTRHIWMLNDAARMPRALKIGRCVRWNMAEITEWIDAGCPDLSRSCPLMRGRRVK